MSKRYISIQLGMCDTALKLPSAYELLHFQTTKAMQNKAFTHYRSIMLGFPSLPPVPAGLPQRQPQQQDIPQTSYTCASRETSLEERLKFIFLVRLQSI